MADKAKQQAISPRLNRVFRLFSQWRRQSGGRGRRIPEDLWAAAGEVARAEGVYGVSQVLRLDYTRLKQWAADAPSVQTVGSDVAFVELSPGPVRDASEAVVEVERRDGARLRLELRGRPELDVAGLVKAVLEGGRS